MKQNDKIINKGNNEVAEIIDAPKPPKKWTIRFEDGSTKLKTKSFLKKYYELAQTK